MNWQEHLSWSQVGALFCALCVIAWVIYLARTTRKPRNVLLAPHHSTQRRGTEAVTH